MICPQCGSKAIVKILDGIWRYICKGCKAEWYEEEK